MQSAKKDDIIIFSSVGQKHPLGFQSGKNFIYPLRFIGKYGILLNEDMP
jgi:hypothetical protein